MTCTNPVRAVRSSDGKLALCCHQCGDDPGPELEARLYVCGGRSYRLCSLVDANAAVDTNTFGNIIYQSWLVQIASDDGISAADPDNNPYPSPFGCQTTVNMRISGVSVVDNPDGVSRDYGIRIELATNPENHPGWDLTLNFPKSGGVYQEVEISFPDSPANGLIGSRVFTFAVDQAEAIDNNPISTCVYPQDFDFWLSAFNTKLRSNGYWWMRDLLFCQTSGRNIPNPNPDGGPCPDRILWDKMESEPQRVAIPNPYGEPEFDTYLWENVYWYVPNRSLWNVDNSGGSNNRRYVQFYNGGTLIPDGNPDKYCRDARQYRLNDNQHFYSYNDVIYERYSGYDEFADFGQLPAADPCGHQRANNFWADPDCEDQPYAVMMDVTIDGISVGRTLLWPKGVAFGFGTYLGGHSANGGVVERPSSSVDPTFSSYVGGIDVGSQLFSGLPVVSLPASGMESLPLNFGSWTGITPLNGGFSMDIESSPTAAYALFYFSGGMGPGKENGADNPTNIKYLTINPNEDYQFELIPGLTCCTPGSYSIDVTVPYRVTYWGGVASSNGTFTVTVDITLTAGVQH